MKRRIPYSEMFSIAAVGGFFGILSACVYFAETDAGYLVGGIIGGLFLFWLTWRAYPMTQADNLLRALDMLEEEEREKTLSDSGKE